MSEYTVYLAGPMRGYPRLNFDAFYEAECHINKHLPWNVLNPARMEAELGFSPSEDGTLDSSYPIGETFDRDVSAVKSAHGIVMLPGWDKSVGAQAEYWIAKWLQKDIYKYEHLVELLRGGTVVWNT